MEHGTSRLILSLDSVFDIRFDTGYVDPARSNLAQRSVGSNLKLIFRFPEVSLPWGVLSFCALFTSLFHTFVARFVISREL